MPKSILDIKNSIDCHLGNRIVLKANGGRKKTIERCGVLKETYPSVFIVELDQDKHNFERVSYTYTLSLIHISEPTRPCGTSRMPSSA